VRCETHSVCVVIICHNMTLQGVYAVKQGRVCMEASKYRTFDTIAGSVACFTRSTLILELALATGRAGVEDLARARVLSRTRPSAAACMAQRKIV
jgi:hypothetical protein